MSNPTFEIYVGPMFSSKTSNLLMSLERYKYQKKKTIVFKPQLDDRYSEENVVTHGGWSTKALTVKTGADLLEIMAQAEENPSVVAVDEAFMIPGIAEVLVFLYKNGFNILVSTLDISASGKPFHEVEKMLPWATYVVKCKAVCTICGADAPYTHKKQASTEEIEIGGQEMYESRCFSHCLAVNNAAVTLAANHDE